MAAAPFSNQLLGWRPTGTPNTADSHSAFSKSIAEAILGDLAIPHDQTVVVAETEQDLETGEKKATAGASFEMAVENHLSTLLPSRWPDRDWEIRRAALISDFDQYWHLSDLQKIVESNPTLASDIGRDYLIKPDVTVAVRGHTHHPFLHASVSCKWTIRSDRVQNIRHEAVVLTRHRRGRQPHIVAVTAEPLPTRLAAIARGTGEVDAVYHIAFEELVRSVEKLVTHATARQRRKAELQRQTIDELIGQGRLKDFVSLGDVLGL